MRSPRPLDGLYRAGTAEQRIANLRALEACERISDAFGGLCMLTKNALWIDRGSVDAGSDEFEGYAIVEGTFEPSMTGHMDLFSGGITRIERLSRLPKLR